MIGRKNRDAAAPEITGVPQSFDDFDLKLGDMMRGERATLGKSLLDVQRELRIKAGYIAAIENCDPSAFDTPGFIAGYVRSYARYLGMDPEEAFAHFCAESGFSVAHGMSNMASTIRKPSAEAPVAPPQRARDPLINPRTPFVARDDSFFTGIQPAAIGSSLVLLALIGGIGYGAWSVLQEVQRVQLAPVDQTPLVLSELDPLDTAMSPSAMPEAQGDDTAGVFTPPSRDWYDRMQRPEALDTPVLVARDGPISTLDPDRGGVYAGLGARGLPQIDETIAVDGPPLPDARLSDVAVVAVRPAWVRVDDASGATLFSGILNGGERFEVPAGAVAPRIEVGESGAVYFAVAGQAYGPAGPTGAVTSAIPLSAADLTARYTPADPAADRDLAPLIASLQKDAVNTAVASALGTLPSPPKVLADAPAGVTVVATADAWVRVRTANGTTLFETVMKAGETYQVPTTETPPTIRAGNAGAIYFAVGGRTFGPYGKAGAVADNLALAADTVSTEMAQADPATDSRLARIVAELSAGNR